MDELLLQQLLKDKYPLRKAEETDRDPEKLWTDTEKATVYIKPSLEELMDNFPNGTTLWKAGNTYCAGISTTEKKPIGCSKSNDPRVALLNLWLSLN